MNKVRYLLITMLFSLSCIPISVYPFISYYLFTNEQGQQILLLGDIEHSSELLYTTNILHVNTLTNLVKQETISAPIPCILAMEEPYFFAIQKNTLASNVIIHTTFKELSKQASQLLDKIKFIPYEPRSRPSSVLTGVAQTILDVIEKSFECDSFSTFWTDFKNQLNAQAQNLTQDVTVEVYLNDLEKNQRILEDLVKKYRNEKDVGPFFMRTLTEYQEAKNKAYFFLTRDKDLQQLFEIASVELLNRCSTAQQALTLYTEVIAKILLSELDENFANACFLDKILDAQKAAYWRVIFIGGEDHIQGFIPVLKKLGYSMVKGITLRKQLRTMLFHVHGDINAFSRGLVNVIENFLKNNPEKDVRSCQVCLNTRTVHKIQVCGKCKKVRYCSIECQAKDWPNHKKVCMPHVKESQH